MNWFEHIRSWFETAHEVSIPPYGRGIHAYPNPKERELFEHSSEAFLANRQIDGYDYFLSSLTHASSSEKLPHLQIEKNDAELTFRLVQGSAVVVGNVTPERFEAYVDITLCDALPVALKRRFLERNFQLTYARFGVKNNVARLSLRLDNQTITPQKIFFPLREIALNADFEKEFIAAEFNESLLLEYSHMAPIDESKAGRYYTFMQEWVRQTRQSLMGLLSNDNTGMASFSYLTVLLQIDYLLMPRKKIARDISEKINSYFLEDERLTEDKNAELERYLAELESMSFENFASQFYASSYTFSPFDQALHDEIAAFIEESLNKVRWYKYNHAHYVIGVIYRYIALYLLFNYGLHPSLRSLLHLHVEISCSDFFASEGEMTLYDPITKTFDVRRISERIRDAIEPFAERYRGLKNFADALNYHDMDHFSQSFYLQIKNLDYTES